METPKPLACDIEAINVNTLLVATGRFLRLASSRPVSRAIQDIVTDTEQALAKDSLMNTMA